MLDAGFVKAETTKLFDLAGPYRFREHRRHVNVTWHHNNDSLSYRTLRSWHYDPTSNGSLNDNITTLNVIAAKFLFIFTRRGNLDCGNDVERSDVVVERAVVAQVVVPTAEQAIRQRVVVVLPGHV
ncbi:hypothetical protein evm_015292 [Chilo suppressalis]|nr:hypothetical protein evm_015292 [Chilo suppressalis]